MKRYKAKEFLVAIVHFRLYGICPMYPVYYHIVLDVLKRGTNETESKHEVFVEVSEEAVIQADTYPEAVALSLAMAALPLPKEARTIHPKIELSSSGNVPALGNPHKQGKDGCKAWVLC
jgi:hypothetical protein